ncbi:hypothetical protein [Catellatospora vulcania]|uniref:hypothetical protein n=1 Tax=Catellatospora vulcania TaxID=1460450 RepID=UPI0012D471F9|nr:hypothetical protein [Catellatospora vulcania]
MRLSTARVAPLAGPTDLDPDVLQNLLWRHHATTDAVEHIRVRAGPGSLDIAVYTLSPTQDQSDTTARELVNRTLARTPQLRLWRLL